jgi:hypothetical protein
MTKLEAKDCLNILGEHVIRARIHYDLWWFLEGEDSRPSIAETLDDFPEFFLFDSNAHFASMIIRSAVVWDKARANVSLPRVANDILDPQCYEAHSELGARIAALGDDVAGLLKIRHKAIAHVTNKQTRVKVFQEAAIIPNDLPSKMSEWLEVINELRLIQDPNLDKSFLFDFRDLPLLHLQKLIHKLGGPDLRPKSSLDQLLGV